MVGWPGWLDGSGRQIDHHPRTGAVAVLPRHRAAAGLDQPVDQADAEAVYAFSSHEFSEFYQAAADQSVTIFEKRQQARQIKKPTDERTRNGN